MPSKRATQAEVRQASERFAVLISRNQEIFTLESQRYFSLPKKNK